MSNRQALAHTDEKPFTSLRQLAQRYGLSRTRVQQLLEDRGVPSYRFSRRRGGAVRYLWRDVLKFEAASRNPGQQRED